VLSIVDLAEKQLSGTSRDVETLVACSGNTRTTLVVLNQDQAERLYDSAETEYYVLPGRAPFASWSRDAARRRQLHLDPRNTGHSILRRGTGS